MLMSDSSAKGFAVHVTAAAQEEVLRLSAACERARFRIEEAAEGPDEEAFAGAAAGPRTPWDDDPLPRQVERVPLRRRRAVAVPKAVPPLPPEAVAPERWRRVVYGAWRGGACIHTLKARR